MNCTSVQNGAGIAAVVPASSSSDANRVNAVLTTGDLLAILKENPSKSFAQLRTTCGLLGNYLGMPGDQISFDLIEDKRRGFRPFLESRRYTENSIRSYVYQQRSLLYSAVQHGWGPDANQAGAWKPLLEMAVKDHLTDIVRYFSRTTQTPAEVTVEAVMRWAEERTREGLLFTTVAKKRNQFWRLLQKTGWVKELPQQLMKFEHYAIPLEELPTGLRNDIKALLKWKQADFAVNRPKRGKIRAITATRLRSTICQFAGFVIHVCGHSPATFKDMVQKHLVESFVEWLLNDRKIMGRSLVGRLGGIYAVLKYHPSYCAIDYSWFKPLLDSITLEDESEIKKRKAKKYVDYDDMNTIPEKIRAVREATEKRKGNSRNRVAQLAMEEFLFRWFLVFPWRQRNIREFRIGGSNPNLFKSKLPPYCAIDKPAWVIEEEAKNPNAEFWQISFSPEEVKTGISVDLIVPQRLIQPLEEYLTRWRPLLLGGKAVDTLLVSPRGKPLRSGQVGKAIGHWTTQFANTRTTPHLIRDSVAYKWLKEHPKDFLSLSKILWHKNVQTTIRIYGSRFDESSGTCAMEAWLDQRSANNDADNIALKYPILS